MPHPDSPAGRTFNWHSEFLLVGHEEQRDVQRQIAELESLLLKQSAALRGVLPDALRDLYEALTARTTTKGAANVNSVEVLSDTLANDVRFFESMSPKSLQIEGLRVLVQIRHLVWACRTAGEKKELLRKVQILSAQFYETAARAIQRQYMEARRSGKQQEFIHQWKFRILPFVQSAGAGRTDTAEAREAELQSQANARRDNPRGSDSGTRSGVKKTWVEFRLIDELGHPVPHASYSITLPDGSVKKGVLNKEGTVRFDDIGPGECEITFPEIDGREWNRV